MNPVGCVPFKVVPPGSDWLKLDFFDWSAYGGLVLHNLYDRPQVFFGAKSPIALPQLLLFYGAEYYNDCRYFREPLYGPRTQRFLDRSQRWTTFRKWFFGRRRPSRVDERKVASQWKAIAFSRLTHFGTHLENEYRSVVAGVGSQAKWVNFSYYTIEDYKVAERAVKSGTPRVIVGNSATASNNHLECFEILRKIGFEGETLCPLSYGDARYGDSIAKMGTHLLGERFRALRQFMPLDEYSQLLGECHAMILNNYRQQSLGNIISSLWLGTRVFVSMRSPVLEHFRALGCSIQCLETDLVSAEDLRPCSAVETERNRSALSRYYARSTFVTSLRRFYTDIDPSRPCHETSVRSESYQS